ncbi:MAG: hypothetical protein AAFZ17_01885 [Cyanobacteria bacterium J06650_10]
MQITDETKPLDSVDFQTVSNYDKQRVEEFVEDAQKPLSGAKSPWLKVGIGLVILAFPITFGLVRLAIGGGGASQEIAETGAEESLTLTLDHSDMIDSGGASEVDQLRSEMALLEQQLAMAAIERGQDVNVPRRSTGDAPNRSSAAEEPAKPSGRTSSPSRVTQRTQPSPRSSVRNVSVSPSRTVTRAPSRSVVRTPYAPPRVASSSPIPTFQPVDPRAQWLAASNAGIMGAAPQILVAGQSRFIENSQPEQPRYQLRGIRNNSELVSYEELSYVDPQSDSIPGLFDAGASVIPGGQSVKATIETPVTWQNQGDQFYIRLDESIMDRNGREILPESSYVIVQPVSVDPSSRLAQLAVVGVAIEDELYEIDYGLLQIKGENGDPLIADTYGDIGGDIAANDIEMIAIGALGRVGEELIRPESETIISSIGGSSVSRQNGSPNILGAILAGGTEELSERMADRNEGQLDEIRSRDSVFYLGEGTTVEVYVNESFEF